MAFNKNHTARLKRVHKELDLALDRLNKASGELWPKELQPFKSLVDAAKDNAEKLHRQVADAIKGVGEAGADEGQTDIEGYDPDMPAPEPEPEPEAAPRSRSRRS